MALRGASSDSYRHVIKFAMQAEKDIAAEVDRENEEAQGAAAGVADELVGDEMPGNDGDGDIDDIFGMNGMEGDEMPPVQASEAMEPVEPDRGLVIPAPPAPDPDPPQQATVQPPTAGGGPWVRSEYLCNLPHFGGHIVFYQVSNKLFAYCANPDHARCIRIRTAEANQRPNRASPGRPLGHLAAWLAEHSLATKSDHTMVFPSFRDRQRARERWRQVDAMFSVLGELERPRRANEPTEPEDMM